MAQVTSIVRDRGRVLGVVGVLAASVMLISAPSAMAVDGDPISTSAFQFKLSSAFKKQLKQNGVKMKPKKLSLDLRGTSDVDPTTGAADLRLKTIVFKKGKKKVIYDRISAALPGKVKSAGEGALFKLTKPTVARSGFGANLTGVKVKFLKSAAKKLNKRLGLNSLKKSNAGTMSLSYQPETVKVLSGEASVEGALVLNPPSVGIKLVAAHCVDGTQPNGVDAIPPATKSGLATFTFPVTGGEISPQGTSGVVEQDGGVRLNKNTTLPGTGCDNGFGGTLTQDKQQVNLTAGVVSSIVTISASAAPPGTLAGVGEKGRANGQSIDGTNNVIEADPAAKTITISGSRILLTDTAAGVLNGVFPNVSGDPNSDFKGGDFFGTSGLTVQTR